MGSTKYEAIKYKRGNVPEHWTKRVALAKNMLGDTIVEVQQALNDGHDSAHLHDFKNDLNEVILKLSTMEMLATLANLQRLRQPNTTREDHPA